MTKLIAHINLVNMSGDEDYNFDIETELNKVFQRTVDELLDR